MAEFKRVFFLLPFFFFLFLLQITTTFGSRPMVEMYSVRIIDMARGGEGGEVYGTIKYKYPSSDYFFIYDIARENAQSISLHEPLLLTDPTDPMPFTVADDAVINMGVFLKVKGNGSSSEDDQLITSADFVFPATFFTMPNNTRLDQGNGSSELEYVFISEAMRANINVTLVNGAGDKENTTSRVYGMLTARDSLFESEILLFRKKSNEEPISLSPGNPIALSRSGVSVSMSSSLVFKADLFDFDLLSSGNNKFVNGDVVFSANVAAGTTFVRSIFDGQNGREIQVTVTWTS